MSHARESLATLLAKPGKRPNARATGDASYFDVIRQLLSDIEAYRTRGYSLGEIYGALVRGGDIGCTIGTFRAYYYRARREAVNAVQTPDVSKTAPDLVQEDHLEQNITHTSELTPGSSLSAEPTVETVTTTSSEPKSLLEVTEEELQSQQALARRMFAKRRVELGMRKRGE